MIDTLMAAIAGFFRAAASDVPLLPQPAVMAVWLPWSWSVVSVAMLAWFGGRGRPLSAARRVWFWPLAIVLVGWLNFGGRYSPLPILGLAFQSPSVLSVVLCARLFWLVALGQTPVGYPAGGDRISVLGWTYVASAAIVGWVLLVDTFALFSVSLYAWGFSPTLVALAVALPLLPWVVLGRNGVPSAVELSMLGVVVTVFLVWRLPTGNLWDALLDPVLWLVLQIHLLLHLSRRRSVVRTRPQV